MDLPVREVTVSGYRSLKAITYPMSRLDVFVGANGVGKSNLYRALDLLQAAAQNQLGARLASEGLDLAMWAGPRKARDPARIALSVTLAAPGGRNSAFRYEVEVGFPQRVTAAAFNLEPQVKVETLTYLSGQRRSRLVERRNAAVMARDAEGRPADLDIDLLAPETLLGRLEDPGRYPELDAVRRTLLEWRFYHDVRTDADSPLRRPCVAVAAPTLASDGANLAAVFATLAHIRADRRDLDEAVANAFPGAVLDLPQPERTATFGLRLPEFPNRVFEPAELSDGTLRFLALAGALLAYRLPPFIALNEPEASLHPDLMAPLAALIAKAAERTQVWLVTHSEGLAQALRDHGAVRTVCKVDGATTIEGLTLFGAFRDDEDD
ncbi:AAA family ATPase [Phenylobacterium sp.]|uniref:AAA family ATPase n=1 Tax=Phenylobacterium sp. TaxID=1871053 RepID=UPI002730EDE6|nr:AAA family ATPase [Phenylobacterium sp.]MDP1874005.1 AAA family ATPase [Phenylobacterium sp.]